MRSIVGHKLEAGAATRASRKGRAAHRRLSATVESLESRNLMSGGTVVLTPGVITITPFSTGANTAIVSYQIVGGARAVDVNLNGTNYAFSPSSVGFIYYMGGAASGAQTFENETPLHSVAWGGSGPNLFESSSGPDEFFGGSGTNTFDAGTGVDELFGGGGVNVFNENAAGSGLILEVGTNNTINVPAGSSGSYQIL